MKKFLSLLLAVVMTLSLVTISAGATEYKDLTDKDELGPQYQEAVAVLNKIGVITGYDDGSFRPDVKLTRGAAAKIIVSLLIGPEAASNLPNNSAPYPDVPASHTFAGVISFCKTKGIISGYGDGTFKPSNDLTGYAFAKMLLGALGYDSATERFTGTGWTQNVLSIGQYASLFDRLDFKGSEAVSRKDAALLALNTLKATVVEYNNPLNISVTGDNTNVVVSGGQTRSYKTSNQEYATNILPHTDHHVDDDWWTVEFAEEHFVDLRLTHDKYRPTSDEYGRPSAEWTYKKLSIGTFPLVPDFEYTTQVAHDVATTSDAAKTRALGLNGYYVDNTAPTSADNTEQTRLWINGMVFNAAENSPFSTVADIADFTDNGTLVEVYVDNNGADRITDVVVIKSQLMEVKRIGSDYVALDLYDKGSDGEEFAPAPIYGFNQAPIDVDINNVEVGDDYYELLSGLKTGDLVVVEPVATSETAKLTDTFDVGTAYVPETVKGVLNGVPERFGNTENNYSALSVDVGGTTYKVSLWNKDLYKIDPEAVKVTKKDVTLSLDKYGNALLAEDVGSTSGWMIVANYRQSIVNGILVTFANGWDDDGNEISLNIGARAGISGSDVWKDGTLPRIGTVVEYTNATNSNTAEWELFSDSKHHVYDVYRGFQNDGTTPYSIAANSSTVTVVSDSSDGYPKDSTHTPLMDNAIKFIYVTMDDSGELDTIEIKKGRTKVENSELSNAQFGAGYGFAQAYVTVKDNGTIDTDGTVEAVVIKKESNDSSWQNMLYVVDYKGSSMRDANGQMVQGYEVAMMSADGLLDTQTIYSYNTALKPGNFARYTKSTHDDHADDFYTLRAYGTTALDTAGRGNAVTKADLQNYLKGNDRLWQITNTGNTRAASGYEIGITYDSDHNVYGTGGNASNFADNMVNLQGAYWLDLSDYDRQGIGSVKELKEAYDNGKNTVTVTLLFNDDSDSDYFRNVYLIVVNEVKVGVPVTPGTDPGTPQPGGDKYTLTLTGNLASATDLLVFDGTTDITATGTAKTSPENGKVLEFQVTKNAKVTIRTNVITAQEGIYRMSDAAHTQVSITGAGVASIASMTGAATVSGLEKVVDGDGNEIDMQTYTVTVEEGITITKFEDESNNNVTSQVTKEGNVYYVPASVALHKITVKTTNTEYAFASKTLTSTMATGGAVASGKTNTDAGATIQLENTGGIDASITVYGATKVTTSNVSGACFGLGGTGPWYVRPGTTLPKSISLEDDGCTCAIAQVGSTAVTYASDYVHNGFEIGTTEVTLKGAFKVVVPEGVAAKISSGDNLAAGTWYVAKGTNLDKATVSPADTNKAVFVDTGAGYGSENAAISGLAQDVTYVVGTKVATAAGASAVTLRTADGKLVASGANATIYVVSGTQLAAETTTSTGSTPIQAKTGTGASAVKISTEQGEQRCVFTVGDDAIEITDRTT